MTASQQAAQSISDYLVLGHHHSTPQGRAAMAAIIREKRPRQRSPWRPIASAPKDEHILLLYQGHDHLPFVCQGRWVQWPHENVHMRILEGKQEPSPSDTEGRWEVGYIAVYQGNRGMHWNASSFLVFPTHWQPLPKPPTRLPKGYSPHP